MHEASTLLLGVMLVLYSRLVDTAQQQMTSVDMQYLALAVNGLEVEERNLVADVGLEGALLVPAVCGALGVHACRLF